MTTATVVLDDAGAETRFGRTTDSTVEVRLLGDFEVRVDGRTITAEHWTRRHSAALVKLLVLSPGQSLHREQVMDALWPDIDVSDAAPRLHKAAHYARKTLGHRDAVVLGADMVRLYPDCDVHVDAARFLQSAQSASDDGGIAAAKAALALHSGVLLPHDLYVSWTEQHRQHLSQVHTTLLHQAEDWHEALVTDPADEAAHLALAHRYAGNGDRAAALRQLDRLDRAMRDDLGLEPSTQAVTLRQQLLVVTPTNRSSADAPCCLQPS